MVSDSKIPSLNGEAHDAHRTDTNAFIGDIFGTDAFGSNFLLWCIECTKSRFQHASWDLLARAAHSSSTLLPLCPLSEAPTLAGTHFLVAFLTIVFRQVGPIGGTWLEPNESFDRYW
jgi:hypothetical protein